MAGISGIILVDKPQDWTSHDVVAKLRGLLHERRIGHSGTLDPMATGVLAVFVGRATRAVEFAEADEKEYIATAVFGITTDTQDITGNILNTCEDFNITEESIKNALNGFVGEIQQIPPMYSAIKQNGKKLYELARRGKTVERKPRRVFIKEIELLRADCKSADIRVVCSKGTYIRTLVSDIGEKLGCGAALSALRRTRAGRFTEGECHTLSQIAALIAENGPESALIPTDELFRDIPEYTADPKSERKIRCGASFDVQGLNDGLYRVYSANGAFLMLGTVQNGIMRAVKSFFEI